MNFVYLTNLTAIILLICAFISLILSFFIKRISFIFTLLGIAFFISFLVILVINKAQYIELLLFTITYLFSAFVLWKVEERTNEF